MPAIEFEYVLIGRRLRVEREKRNLTQSEVAGKLGLPRSGVSNIEKGKQRLLLHTFLDYASALDMPPSSLLDDLHRVTPTTALHKVATDSGDAITQQETAAILSVVQLGRTGA